MTSNQEILFPYLLAYKIHIQPSFNIMYFIIEHEGNLNSFVIFFFIIRDVLHST